MEQTDIPLVIAPGPGVTGDEVDTVVAAIDAVADKVAMMVAELLDTYGVVVSVLHTGRAVVLLIPHKVGTPRPALADATVPSAVPRHPAARESRVRFRVDPGSPDIPRILDACRRIIGRWPVAPGLHAATHIFTGRDITALVQRRS